MYQRSVHAHNLDIYVVDLDGGNIGSFAKNQILSIPQVPEAPTWHEKTGFESVEQVKEWVRINTWGALVINPGASQRLQDALDGKATSYDATDALTLIPSSGRHIVAEMLFIESALSTAAYSVNQKYTMDIVTTYSNNNNSSSSSSSQSDDSSLPNLDALLNPIGYTTTDASPEGFAGAPVLTTFSTLCVLLCSIAFLIMWKLTTVSFFERVRYFDLVLMWITLLFGLALGLGLFVAFAMLAYRGPGYNDLARTYTGATFFKVWFTTVLEAFPLGLWLYNWFLFLPPHILAWPSIATVITNVISCIGCPELAPSFYHIMYSTPGYNFNRIIQYILTGAYPHVGKWVGILIAEIVAMCLILCVSVWLRQLFVLRGISDGHGFYRGSTYFHSSIPYYKDDPNSADKHGAGQLDTESTLSAGRYRHNTQVRRGSSGIDISDCNENDMGLRAGELGV
ncbi:hypothetical protein GGI07_004804 [Coemansia sp. Benny D115]|nr:hypothetical protein GGI07_004804 [Coemansia sp. Benny D115]